MVKAVKEAEKTKWKRLEELKEEEDVEREKERIYGKDNGEERKT